MQADLFERGGAKPHRNFKVIMWCLASTIASFRSELSASTDKHVSQGKYILSPEGWTALMSPLQQIMLEDKQELFKLYLHGTVFLC